MDFSLAAALLISSSGNATSISFFLYFARTSPIQLTPPAHTFSMAEWIIVARFSRKAW